MFGIPLDEINASYEAYLGGSEEAKATFGQGTLDNLALFKMAELEAAETGITVSDSEVTAQMKQSFGYTDAEAETERKGSVAIARRRNCRICRMMPLGVTI